MRLILLIIGLVLLIWTASATDFYVDATTGDNGDDGLSLVNAFLTITYAEAQMSNDDNLYVVDGTYNESFTSNLDNITMSGYNSKPVVNLSTGDFLITSTNSTYENLTFYNGGSTDGANVRVTGTNNRLINITSYSPSGAYNGFSIIGDFTYMYNTETYNSGWNGLLISMADNIYIDSHHGHDEHDHNVIDLYGNCDNITIINSMMEDSSYAGIYFHSTGHLQTNILIESDTINNTIYGIRADDAVNVSDMIIQHCVLSYITRNGIIPTKTGTNITVHNTSVHTLDPNLYEAVLVYGSDGQQTTTFSNNSLTGSNMYRFINSPNNVHYIIDPASSLGMRSDQATTDIYLQSTEGKIRKGTFGTSFHYSNGTSILGLTSPTPGTKYWITRYHIALTPTAGYCKDIVVNVNKVNDVTNITSNVSETATVIFNFPVVNATNTYNLYVDGIYNTSAVSDSNKIVSFDYAFSSLVPTDFEVTWASSGSGDNDEITFVSPTLANGSTTSNDYVEVNASIFSSNLTEFIWNWNGTNYTFYDSSYVLHMDFENNSAIGENSTFAVDVSQQGNNGSFTGNWTSDGAIKLNGINEYIDIATPPITGSEDRAIIAWVKTSTHTRDIVSWGNNANGEESRLGLNADGKFLFGVYGGYALYTSVVTNNEINCIGIVLNGTKTDNVTGYFNGEPDTRSALSSRTVNTANANGAIGRKDSTGDRYFKDDIYKVLIIKGSPSAEVMKQIYLSNLEKYNSTYWYFESNQTNLSNGEYNYQAFTSDVESDYRVVTVGGAPDTKFEYYNGTGWQEGESEYYLWFECFWITTDYPDGVAPNAEQSGSQHTLRITNNGTAAGVPMIKFNESTPAEVTVYVDDDYTVAGAVSINDTYQAVGSSLAAGHSVNLSAWVNLTGLTSIWEYEVYADIQ